MVHPNGFALQSCACLCSRPPAPPRGVGTLLQYVCVFVIVCCQCTCCVWCLCLFSVSTLQYVYLLSVCAPVSPPTYFVSVCTSECMTLVVSVDVCSQWYCEWPFYQSVVVSKLIEISRAVVSKTAVLLLPHPLMSPFKVLHKRLHNVWSVCILSP